MAVACRARQVGRIVAGVMVVALAVALLPAHADAVPKVDPRSRTSAERAAERQVFADHNRARENPGRFGYPRETSVPALEWDEHLAQVARQWSDVMARDGRMRHNPHWVEQSEIAGRGGAESVAHSGWGTGNVGAVGLTQLWMDSKGHRDNIMREPYASVGIGISIDARGELWATAVFAAAVPDPIEMPDPEDEVWPWNDEHTPHVRDLTGLCPPVAASRFVDVHSHVDAVDCLAALEITEGVGAGRYDPSGTVTRGQMAVFIDRVVGGAPPQPNAESRFLRPNDDAAFPDVSAGQTDAVARLAAAGIVSGYPDGTYRPQQPVTRAQMAHFLVATHEYLQGTRVRGPFRSWFRDGRHSGSFWQQVNIAAERGFAAGNEGMFFPQSPVRRDHMALFLLRLVVAQDDDSFVQPLIADRDVEVDRPDRR